MLLHQKVTIALGTVTLALCAVWAAWPDDTTASEETSSRTVVAARSRRVARERWVPRSRRPADTTEDVDLAITAPPLFTMDEVPADAPVDEMPLADADADADAGDEDAAVDRHEQQLVERLGVEGRDSEWSASTETAIQDALRADAFTGSSVVDASCAVTLCRAEVELDDEPARERFIAQVTLTPPFATSGMIRDVGTDENPRLVVYFARDGHTI